MSRQNQLLTPECGKIRPSARLLPLGCPDMGLETLGGGNYDHYQPGTAAAHLPTIFSKQSGVNPGHLFVGLTAHHIFTSSSCTFIPIPLVISGQNISTFIPSTMTKLSIFFLSWSVLYAYAFWNDGCTLHIFVLIFKMRLIRLNAQIRGGWL